METIALERSLWINGSRARIWQAITDPDQMVKWFSPSLVGAQMQRDETGKIVIQFGPVSIDFAAVEDVDEPDELTIRSLPDRLIRTTYLLSEENDRTCIKVRVTGFEALLESAQQDRLNISGMSWEKALKNLSAFVSDTELPFPQAFVAPLFGYWREAKTTLSTERSIWIDAPRERVWRAVTDPKEIQGWMSPAIPWEMSALEVGGRFYVRDEATQAEMYVEVIELLEPPHQLAIRTVPEPPDTLVKGKIYTLKEENGGTRLTVTVSGYEQQAEELRNIEQDTFGLGMMLQNTKAYIEDKELPFPGGF